MSASCLLLIHLFILGAFGGLATRNPEASSIGLLCQGHERRRRARVQKRRMLGPGHFPSETQGRGLLFFGSFSFNICFFFFFGGGWGVLTLGRSDINQHPHGPYLVLFF